MKLPDANNSLSKISFTVGANLVFARALKGEHKVRPYAIKQRQDARAA
ncbi:MAG: hypothetical protein PHU44_16970 [Syntrophales bacterium]|nr:hypothetical protein [Syntrophales bacterium]